jgi:GT2 family glycosyltransferase
LTSIANQNRLPDEVIAVDDHSPDETGSVLEEQLERLRERGDVHCTLLTNERNRGQAYSLNRAIAEADSDLIMILNDDDYLLPGAIGLMLDLFQRYRDVVLIGGTSLQFTSDAQLTTLSVTGRNAHTGEALVLSVRQPADVPGYKRYNDLNMTHSGSCFLKSAWKAVGGYNPDKRTRIVPFSDRDFQLRVNALFPVAVSSEVSFSCWRSGSSVDCGRDS